MKKALSFCRGEVEPKIGEQTLQKHTVIRGGK